MKKSVHHVQLNEKLQECFEILDGITKQYRQYNEEYIQLVNHHPQTVDEYFNLTEKDCLEVFKVYGPEKRTEIEELFTKETEQKQKNLEDEAMKKYEEEKKIEDAKKQEEEKSKP